MGSRPRSGRFYSPVLDDIRHSAADGKCRAARGGSTPEWPFAYLCFGTPFLVLALLMQWELWGCIAAFMVTGRFPQFAMLPVIFGGLFGLLGGSFITFGVLRLLFPFVFSRA